MDLNNEQQFEALKLRYQDHVELLRTMTMMDFRIFSGFITLQLILAAWLSNNPITEIWLKFGILLVDISLATLAGKLLYNDYRRRGEVVNTLKNINSALGFDKAGIYIEGKINAPTIYRPWWWWYMIGVVVAVAGVAIVILA